MGKGMRAGKKPSSGIGGGSMQKQLQQMQAMQRKKSSDLKSSLRLLTLTMWKCCRI